MHHRLVHRPLMALRTTLAAVSLLALGLVSSALGLAPAAQALEMRSDGIHTESWMKSMTFLDLKEDAAEAKAKGKGLVIIFEQPGCGSCKRLHEVNFQEKPLVDYITQHFDVMQINMYGDNLVTDFDGEELSEVRFSEKVLINFSPTTLFYAPDGSEIFRIPGYLAPNFYLSGFEYVVDEGPQKGIMFPRWMKAKRDRLAAEKAPAAAN